MQIYVQDESKIPEKRTKLKCNLQTQRLAFLYRQNMYVHDAQCNLTLITSVSLILSQMQSGSEVQCALVSGVSGKQRQNSYKLSLALFRGKLGECLLVCLEENCPLNTAPPSQLEVLFPGINGCRDLSL